MIPLSSRTFLVVCIFSLFVGASCFNLQAELTIRKYNYTVVKISADPGIFKKAFLSYLASSSRDQDIFSIYVFSSSERDNYIADRIALALPGSTRRDTLNADVVHMAFPENSVYVVIANKNPLDDIRVHFNVSTNEELIISLSFAAILFFMICVAICIGASGSIMALRRCYTIPEDDNVIQQRVYHPVEVNPMDME